MLRINFILSLHPLSFASSCWSPLWLDIIVQFNYTIPCCSWSLAVLSNIVAPSFMWLFKFLIKLWVTQLCLTLCNPMDHSLPLSGSSFPGAQTKNLPGIQDQGSIPGSGRSLGEGNGNPLQYSCLKNYMDRGVWQATQSMGSQRVGHSWATNTFTFFLFFNTFTFKLKHIILKTQSLSCTRSISNAH